MPRKILLACDGSPDAGRAAEYVARHAKHDGVTDVVLLNVQAPGSIRSAALHRNETLLDAIAAGQEATAAARQALEAAGLGCRFLSVTGDPAEAIVMTAEDERVDEIVLGRRGQNRSPVLGLGSVSFKVVHLAELPVTVVGRPGHGLQHYVAENGAHRILVPLDESETALRVADYLCSLARSGQTIHAHLVNVQLPVFGVAAPAPVTQEMIEARYHELGEAVLHAPSEKLRAAGVVVDRHIMAGHVVETIVQLAETLGCERIVMGTRGPGILDRLALGSVAYGTLHRAGVPVTLLK